MAQKYECKITKKDEYTYVQCEFGDEDNYIIEPDFSGFPRGGLIIARQFGPNETDDEGDKNVRIIEIEKREIVDKLKDFLSSAIKKMEAEYNNITYRFEKESHGWLRVEAIYKQGGETSIIDILIHKDVVPFMKQIVDQNFT